MSGQRDRWSVESCRCSKIRSTMTARVVGHHRLHEQPDEEELDALSNPPAGWDPPGGAAAEPPRPQDRAAIRCGKKVTKSEYWSRSRQGGSSRRYHAIT
jgi:hypothetical protein